MWRQASLCRTAEVRAPAKPTTAPSQVLGRVSRRVENRWLHSQEILSASLPVCPAADKGVAVGFGAARRNDTGTCSTLPLLLRPVLWAVLRSGGAALSHPDRG